MNKENLRQGLNYELTSKNIAWLYLDMNCSMEFTAQLIGISLSCLSHYIWNNGLAEEKNSRFEDGKTRNEITNAKDFMMRLKETRPDALFEKDLQQQLLLELVE